MNTDKYTVGSQLESWNGSTAQSLTFIVTEDCNLRCKYCYITHKASNKKMNFSVAKKFIDYVLNSEMIKQHAVTLDFIGGEPLLEIELIDKICDYFKLKTYEMGISWYWNYRISICTNGVNYLDKRIQKFISKNRILHIVPAKVYEESKKMYKDVLPVFTLDDINDMAIKSREIENIIFNISEKDINKLYDCILKLWKIADRINLNIIDLNGKFELDVYKKQLQKIKDIIVMGVHNNSFNKELNVLTDILFINQHNNCGAGDKAVTLGPDGKFYVCPAFYSDKTEKDIGNLENGIDEFPNKQLYTQKFAPVCNCCDAYHCVDCVYHNKKYTTEVHIPASSQCQKSWVEKNVSAQIVKECQDIATYFNAVKESDEIDPINILRRELAHENIGYYTTK